jgi:hypothetical protein
MPPTVDVSQGVFAHTTLEFGRRRFKMESV